MSRLYPVHCSIWKHISNGCNLKEIFFTLFSVSMADPLFSWSFTFFTLMFYVFCIFLLASVVYFTVRKLLQISSQEFRLLKTVRSILPVICHPDKMKIFFDLFFVEFHLSLIFSSKRCRKFGNRCEGVHLSQILGRKLFIKNEKRSTYRQTGGRIKTESCKLRHRDKKTTSVKKIEFSRRLLLPRSPKFGSEISSDYLVGNGFTVEIIPTLNSQISTLKSLIFGILALSYFWIHFSTYIEFSEYPRLVTLIDFTRFEPPET